MRLLLDESLPRPLADLLVGHDVRTVTQMGWTSLSNGALLRQAAAEFDALLTADQNIEFQQNLTTLTASSLLNLWLLMFFRFLKPANPRSFSA